MAPTPAPKQEIMPSGSAFLLLQCGEFKEQGVVVAREKETLIMPFQRKDL